MKGLRGSSVDECMLSMCAAPLPPRNELVVSGELERELSADAPLHRRLRALKEVGEKAIHIRVQEVSSTLNVCYCSTLY